ncbi:MAG: hypothetical protein CFE43_08700 [Burkholderiales bacterium PBB3]|nr:MAG: hypothetical protein CFE43_08700 [Burkholderiales bacterium PBB3]
MLKTKTVSARTLPEGIEVTFAAAEEGVKVPEPQVYDLVLQAVGRTPPDGHSKCSTYGQSNCSTSATVN